MLFDGLTDAGRLDLNRLPKRIDLDLKIIGLTLSPEVRNEKNTRNRNGVMFSGCIDGDGTGSKAREGGGY